MIYGYASNRSGSIFTHTIGFEAETLKKMEEHSHRFDGSSRGHRSLYSDIPPVPQASFVHLNEQAHEDFIKEFDIYLVDTKKELQFLKKIMT